MKSTYLKETFTKINGWVGINLDKFFMRIPYFWKESLKQICIFYCSWLLYFNDYYIVNDYSMVNDCSMVNDWSMVKDCSMVNDSSMINAYSMVKDYSLVND